MFILFMLQHLNEQWTLIVIFVTDGPEPLSSCSCYLSVCVYNFFRVSPCSSSPLWIHWGSTLTWLLMASRLERQMWSFAPTKMLWQPCPKTRITCVCIFFFTLPVLTLALVTPLLISITLCSWYKTTWLIAGGINCLYRSRKIAQICQLPDRGWAMGMSPSS